MWLKDVQTIEIPNSLGSEFDHGAFDPTTRRVFVAHTARDCVEVLDHEHHRHVATLPGFPGAAGVVADEGHVLVTNRGAASLAWIDAETFKTRAIFDTGPRPNGVAIVAHLRLGIVACIGDDNRGPTLNVVRLDGGQRWSIDLPGRPRWCVTDTAGKRVFLAIREPSMVLAAQVPDLGKVEHWKLPSAGAHGLDIDQQRHRLYIACDGAALVEMDALTGQVLDQWPLAGVPDATFFNPGSGWVHVAIEDPGLVQSVHPGSGTRAEFTTGQGAKTTALVAPSDLYVFSPVHCGALVLSELGDRQ
jgi:hypothetical protein